MSAIHLLDNSLINKIAAGEVVERPASVVKELVENSIDAGATAITIEIKDGGINLIKITDNGCGIPKEQVKTAFMRHATSKLEHFEDLESILTLGFRGEALSSISSVAQVEMITKTVDDELGTRIEINGGSIVSQGEIAATTGTTFVMRNLFYNTPARRKFLKKPATESGYVSDIINKIALGHPHISFKYINNNSTMLHTSGNNDIKTTVFHIYGKEVANKMIELNAQKDGFELEGLVAKPELSRANRNYESFFINGRYIKSTVIQNAVEEAYKGKLMVGKFPVFVINMKVPENTVDVNVHPTKLEVRFANEDMVYELVYDAVLKSLKNENLIPQVSWDRPKYSEVADKELQLVKPEQVKMEYKNNTVISGNEEYSVQNKESVPISVEEAVENNKDDFSMKSAMNKLYSEKRVISDKIKENTIPIDDIKALKKEEVSSEVLKNKLVEEKEASVKEPFFKNYKIVGQIFNTYWIIEQNNSMYLIDQHAAHERALYEELLNKVKCKESVSQMLLQPVAINLSESEKQIVNDNMELLESFGFELEELGAKAYALRAVPYVFNNPSETGFFTDIIDMLADKNIDNIYDTRLDSMAMMSCKAAVKGNDRLSYTEAKALIEKIIRLENPFTCPHGRPTIIEMSRYELEKKFKRIQN